jgi:TP901 family phage tail tape measure protein
LPAFDYTVQAQLQIQLNQSSLTRTLDEVRGGLKSLSVPINVNLSSGAGSALSQIQSTLERIANYSQESNQRLLQMVGAARQASVSMGELVRQGAAHNANLVSINSATRQLATHTTAALSPAQQLGSALNGAGGSLLGLTSRVGALVGLVALLRESAREAIAVDTQLTKLAQINVGSADRQRLGRAAVSIGTDLGLSPSEILKEASAFTRLGLDVSSTEKALRSIGEAARGPTFGSITEAANLATSALKSFSAQGTSVEQVLDSATAVSQRFAVSASEIGTGVNEAGRAFSLAGGNVQQLISLFGSLKSSSGEGANAIGTSLRIITTRLQRPEVLDNLRRLGIEVKGQNPFQALQTIGQSIAGSDSSVSQEVGAQLGGIRQASRVLSLLTDVDKATLAYNTALYSNGATADAAAKANNSLSVEVGRVKSGIDAFAVGVSQNKVFRGLADDVLSLTSGTLQYGSALQALLPLLITVSATKAAGLSSPFLTSGAVGKVGLGLLAASAVAPTLLGGESGQVASSAVGLAAAGTFAGASFGPAGAVIGGVVGGLYGLVTSLREAERQIRQLDFEKASDKFTRSITELSSGGAVLSGRNIGETSSLLQSIARQAEARAAEQVGSGSLQTFRDLRERELRSGLGGRLPELATVLQKFVQTGGSTQSEFFKVGSQELSQASGKSLADVIKNIIDGAESAKRQAEANKRASDSAELLSRSLSNLTAITQAVTSSSVQLGGLEANTGLLSSVARGGSLSFSSAVTPSLRLLGSPDGNLFQSALGNITGLLGASGKGLAVQGASANELLRVLPDVLIHAGGKPLLASENFSDRVSAGLQGKGIDAEHISQVLGKLDDFKPEGLFERLKDVGAFTKELTSGITRPLEDAFVHIGQELENRGKSFLSALNERQTELRAILSEQVQLETLRVSVLRDSAQRFAESIGRPSSGLDFLPLSAQLQPFAERQRLLTGLPAGQADNPTAISGRFKEVLQAAETTQKQLTQSAPGSEKFQQTASKLSDLQAQAVNLKQALAALADASGRNVVLQERLAAATADREGRLSLGEKILTGGPQEIARLVQGALITLAAFRQGSFAGLPGSSAAIDFLNSVKSVRLGGAFGNITGEDLKKQLIGKTFGIAPGAEETSLKDQISANLDNAVKAQTELVNLQKGLQESFFSKTLDTNAAFLQNLRDTLLQVEIQKQKVQLGALTAEQTKLQPQAQALSLLTSIGIDDKRLTALRGNQALLEQFTDVSRQATSPDILQRSLALGRSITGRATDFDFPLFEAPTGKPEVRNRFFEQAQAAKLPITTEDVDEIFRRVAQHLDASPRQYNQAREAIIADVVSRRQAALQSDVSAKRDEIGRVTGLSGDALSKFTTSLLANQEQILSALRAIESLEKTTAALERVARDLAATKASIAALQPVQKAAGGVIYAHDGFRAQGTDTVPAMLTPGEFVVNRDAARAFGYDRLHAINRRNDTFTINQYPHQSGRRGYADGGQVGAGPYASLDSATLQGLLAQIQAELARRRGVAGDALALPRQAAFPAQLDPRLDLLRRIRSGRLSPSDTGLQVFPADISRPPINSNILGLAKAGKLSAAGIGIKIIPQVDNTPASGRTFLERTIDRLHSQVADVNASLSEYQDAGLAAPSVLLGRRRWLQEQLTGKQITKTEVSGSRYGLFLPGRPREFIGAIPDGVGPTLTPTPGTEDFDTWKRNRDARGPTEIDRWKAARDARPVEEGEAQKFLRESRARRAAEGPTEIERWLERKRAREAAGFAAGGPVGSTDTVPAMLTPGEFVVNRDAAQAAGYPNLEAINRVRRYAGGGAVDVSGGPGGSPIPATAFESMGRLERALATFSSPADRLSEALGKFSEIGNTLNNMRVSHEGNQVVTVQFTGAQMFQGLEPYIRQMVEQKTQQVVIDVFKRNLPDAEQPTFSGGNRL